MVILCTFSLFHFLIPVSPKGDIMYCTRGRLEADRQTDRQAIDSQADRQTDRQTDRQVGRQAGRETIATIHASKVD